MDELRYTKTTRKMSLPESRDCTTTWWDRWRAGCRPTPRDSKAWPRGQPRRGPQCPGGGLRGNRAWKDPRTEKTVDGRVYFRTQHPNLGKFWRALDRRMLIYFMTIWYIWCWFGIFSGFGIMYKEKSGNLVDGILHNQVKWAPRCANYICISLPLRASPEVIVIISRV
jgi:hypothetical protein